MSVDAGNPTSHPETLTVDEVKRHIWRNTISNYVCVAVRLVMGVVIIRLLYAKLPWEEVGFWAMLWSIFGYGILLDFGFGFTVQKRTAELTVHRDWPELSQVLSTVFFTYIGLGAFICLAGVFGAPFLIELWEITPENQPSFQEVLIVFLCGLGLAFPIGLFPEILRGLHRISLANYILLGGMILNFILTATALYQGWGIKVLVLIALICTFLPDLISGWIAFRLLPEVRIRYRYFSRKMIRKTMSFSLFAYIVTVSNLILTKTDYLVIGSALAVSAVPIYFAGAKISEMFFAFTQQLPETLSPAAAHHYARGDRSSLRELLTNGTRFSLMISTPLYCLCAIFMHELLRVLTKTPDPSPQTYWVAQILLLWIYMMVVTQSVSKRIFMMCGHERRLMWLSVGEAILNLGLSIGLVLYFQAVWGVALGSLIATVFFGWVFLWPWSAREAGLNGWTLARVVLIPTWTACLPLLAVAVLLKAVPLFDVQFSMAVFIAQGCLAVVVAVLGVWRLGLNAEERDKLIERLAAWRRAV